MAFSLRVLFCFVVALAPIHAWAGQALEVQDTATEGRGNYLLQLDGDYLKDESLRSMKLTALITAGTGEHTDLSLEAPYLLLDPSPVTGSSEQGKGDLRLIIKHQLFENEVKQSMAYRLYTYFPTGRVNKGLGKDNVIWGGELIDSQVCHDNIIIARLGYETFGGDTRKYHFATDYAVMFGFAAGHTITEKFRFLSEFAGENRRESGSYVLPLTFLAGFVYDISRSWSVDLGARAGLNKYAEDYTLRAGTAWKF